jgi:DNA-binding IclR family transcriptional regulator
MRGSQRLFGIVEELSNRSMNLTELASSVELPKSTTLRFLRDLEEANWVSRDHEGIYSLGANVVALAAQYLTHNELVAAATPHMRALRADLDETVSLSRRIGPLRVCVQEFPSTQSLRLVLGIGERGPLHAGASGILLYSHMPDEERRQLADEGFESYTGRTITDFDALEVERKKVLAQGWCVTHGTKTKGGVAMAVPLADPDSDGDVAALGLFGPELRCATKAEQERWRQALLKTAADISATLSS